jgi:putative transposase
MNKLLPNVVIEWNNPPRDKYERVLWINEKDNQVVLYPLSLEINKKGAKPLPVFVPLTDIEEAILLKLVSVSETDSFTKYFAPNSEFVAKHKARRDDAWNVIRWLVKQEPDIYDASFRGKAVQSLSEDLKISKITIYKWLRKYWKYGKSINCLLPMIENCGGPGKTRAISVSKLNKVKSEGGEFPKRGKPSRLSKLGIDGINLTTEDVRKISKVINNFHLNSESEPSLYMTYRHLLRTEYDVSVTKEDRNHPSFHQMKYIYYRDFKPSKRGQGRKGQKEFNQNLRFKPGSSLDDPLIGPGDIYQMDSTTIDIVLVNRLNRERRIQKATIYLIIDVFSRFIPGFHVGFEKGWDGMSRALIDCFLFAGENRNDPSIDKKNYCSLPATMVFDRGSEFMGLNSDHLVEDLGIVLNNVPSYRPELKGIIESKLNFLKNELRSLPGFCKQDFKRGDKNPSDGAVLTLPSLRKIIAMKINDYNQNHYLEQYPLDPEMLKNNIKPIPKELWEWGIKRKSGVLNAMPLQKVLANLLPQGAAKVTSNGIKFKQFLYSFEKGVEEEWFIKGSSYIGKKVRVAFDYNDIGVLFVYSERMSEMYRCELISKFKQYIGLSYQEYEDMKNKQLLDRDQSKLSNLYARIKSDHEEQGILNVDKQAQHETKLFLSLNKAQQNAYKKELTKSEKLLDQSEGNTLTKHLKNQSYSSNDVLTELDDEENDDVELDSDAWFRAQLEGRADET